MCVTYSVHAFTNSCKPRPWGAFYASVRLLVIISYDASTLANQVSFVTRVLSRELPADTQNNKPVGRAAKSSLLCEFCQYKTDNVTSTLVELWCFIPHVIGKVILLFWPANATS